MAEQDRAKRLLELCASEENKLDEIRDLLKRLSEDERGRVVNYPDEVRPKEMESSLL